MKIEAAVNTRQSSWFDQGRKVTGQHVSHKIYSRPSSVAGEPLTRTPEVLGHWDRHLSNQETRRLFLD
jgi:hypothetical protein